MCPSLRVPYFSSDLLNPNQLVINDLKWYEIN